MELDIVKKQIVTQLLEKETIDAFRLLANLWKAFSQTHDPNEIREYLIILENKLKDLRDFNMRFQQVGLTRDSTPDDQLSWNFSAAIADLVLDRNRQGGEELMRQYQAEYERIMKGSGLQESSLILEKNLIVEMSPEEFVDFFIECTLLWVHNVDESVLVEPIKHSKRGKIGGRIENTRYFLSVFYEWWTGT
jgi:hypothetical protein